MLLFSTVLFVDGNPVGYKVYEEKDRIVLNPAENPNREVQPPVLSVARTNGQFQVKGTDDQNLIDQVVEDISQNAFLPYHPLAAAP
jgi:hypothetical protein